jgi:hypothetical protein
MWVGRSPLLAALPVEASPVATQVRQAMCLRPNRKILSTSYSGMSELQGPGKKQETMWAEGRDGWVQLQSLSTSYSGTLELPTAAAYRRKGVWMR